VLAHRVSAYDDAAVSVEDSPGTVVRMSTRGTLHHLELWVADLAEAETSWGWLLGRLDYEVSDRWANGESWRLDQTYIVLDAGPDRVEVRHDRLRPGLNHVAFFAGSPGQVEALVTEAPLHGWTLLFADRHPHAGGPQQYAAYLEDTAGFEVELVANDK
jgi:catechol 2,3-dioxygenase-like lactoylglutathione lyase family enzyme